MHQYDHRFATYLPDGSTRDVTVDEHRDSEFAVVPRYWVAESEGRKAAGPQRNVFIGFRAIARATDERAAIFSLLPFVGTGNSLPIVEILGPYEGQIGAALIGNVGSFTLDYVTRQKIGGANFNFFIVKQLPVIPPHIYTDALLAHITPRVLELTYTAWDMQPFARDLGYAGAPFMWDDDRRAQLRADLDGIYAHLYGLTRDDFSYILETFPIVKRNDEKAFGEFRTKRLCLEAFDRFATDAAVQEARLRLDCGEGVR